MTSIQVVCVIVATLCVERGLGYLALRGLMKKNEKLKKSIEGKKGPSLGKLVESHEPIAKDNDMSTWIADTQNLVDAINDVVTISGKNVKDWSMSDIIFISNRIQGGIK